MYLFHLKVAQSIETAELVYYNLLKCLRVHIFCDLTICFEMSDYSFISFFNTFCRIVKNIGTSSKISLNFTIKTIVILIYESSTSKCQNTISYIKRKIQ